MRTKIRVKCSAVLLILAIVAFAVGLFLFVGSGGVTSASAATMPKYTMTFAYTHYYTYNTSKSMDGSASGTTSATVKANNGSSVTVKFYLYGSSTSGEAVLPMGGAITERNITISMDGKWQSRGISVKNSAGTSVGSSYNGTLSLSNLSDDTYTMTCNMTGSGWNPNGRSYAYYSMTATSMFVIDSTAPTISGASTSTTGKFTNSAFTVSASDSVSGVKNLYMKAPNSSSYTAVGTSRTVTEGSANGLYSFYAKDKAGNTSSTYYVYYDTSLPVITAKYSSGTTISGAYANTLFYCQANDTGSGISYMQYKTPSQTSWTSYTGGMISTTSVNGLYQFRAVDKAGNTSATKTITFDTVKPSGTIYGENTVISSGGATKVSYIRFTASDKTSGINKIYVKKPNTSAYTTYTEGTQFTENGTYSFYCTDNAGNASVTYTVTLDNTAPELLCSQTAFYETSAYDFTVKATDATGTATLYYKTPLMTEYAAASNGSYSVVTIDSDGRYYFYAQDAVGNRSETKWIELNVETPTATIERDNNTNHYRITWDGASTGRLNDTPYTKGTWITQEGEYTFVITSTSNRSNTYRFTIAHGFVAVQTVEPTCTEKGYTVYKCLTCDVSYNSDYVDARGHSYDEQLIGENCLEGAYYLYTCSVCGHQYKSEYLTTGGHKFDKTIVKATCTDRGYTIYRCTVCDHTYRDDYTAALGHNFNITVLEPTCLEGGYTTYECKRCDYEYIADYTPAIGHNYEETVVEATCTERGYKLHRCSFCGDEYKTDETFALGHYYTERTQEVTCTQDGCILHTCTRCGFEYETNVTKALGHKYVSEVTMPATCADDGNRHFLCARCGDQYDTAIPAFGHTYEITDVKTDGGITVRTYSCSICGHSYTQDLGDQYEEVSNYVEYLFRQYAPYMWWVFLAVAGVWSIAMGIAIIVANKNEDKQKAKKMLVNYVIGLVVIAVILIACPYFVRGIAALIAG